MTALRILKVVSPMTSNASIGPDDRGAGPLADESMISLRLESLRRLYAYEASIRWMPAEARVLEIGAGPGHGANHLAGHVAYLVATDLSRRAAREALERYRQIPYCNVDGTRLAFAADSFDVVISFQVIEHIPRVGDYLQELRRVLKPNGRLLVTTPNRRWRLLPLQRPWNPEHVREYDMRGLLRTLGGVFPSVEVYGVVASPDLMARAKAEAHQDPLFVYSRLLKGLLRKLASPVLREPPRRLAAALAIKPAPRVLPEVRIDSTGLWDFGLSSDADEGLDFFAVAAKTGPTGVRK